MSDFIDTSSSLYPKELLVLKNPPEKLYYKGEFMPSIFENSLAVVGSRRMTKYGKRVTEKLVAEIASLGITVVSGFMYGIDATAHNAALVVGGKTVAVLACGIDLINPGYQSDLYSEIAKSGLILSEYPDMDVPQLWTYVQRNRIVAGLVRAVLVIEAGEGSGSLITANLAMKMGKPVFCVAGNIDSANSAGTLDLIKSGKAQLVTCAEDVVSFYGLSTAPLFVEPTHDKLLLALGREALTVDELTRITGLDAKSVSGRLIELMLVGKVTQDGSVFYVNKS